MPWQQRVWEMAGQPVGISFRDGRSTSGVLCNVGNRTLYVMEFINQGQFVMRHYHFNTVQDVSAFPPCEKQQKPKPRLY